MQDNLKDKLLWDNYFSVVRFLHSGKSEDLRDQHREETARRPQVSAHKPHKWEILETHLSCYVDFEFQAQRTSQVSNFFSQDKPLSFCNTHCAALHKQCRQPVCNGGLHETPWPCNKLGASMLYMPACLHYLNKETKQYVCSTCLYESLSVNRGSRMQFPEFDAMDHMHVTLRALLNTFLLGEVPIRRPQCITRYSPSSSSFYYWVERWQPSAQRTW